MITITQPSSQIRKKEIVPRPELELLLIATTTSSTTTTGKVSLSIRKTIISSGNVGQSVSSSKCIVRNNAQCLRALGVCEKERQSDPSRISLPCVTFVTIRKNIQAFCTR